MIGRNILYKTLTLGCSSAGNKSFFTSFFSKKEESSFCEEKEAKRLLILRAASSGRFFRLRGGPCRGSFVIKAAPQLLSPS
jgi:hypothetical protein